MSASSDCASGESGTWRRSRPAITSMPASGFFSSCAMPAAISPSDASRSRSRSRSSSCSTCVRSLKNITAPIALAVVVLAPATACSRSRGRGPSAAARRGSAAWLSSNAPRQHADDVRARRAARRRTAGRCRRRRRASAKIRYASSFISASVPSRWIASTPLRMLLTMCRKNRSSGVGRVPAGAAGRAAATAAGRRGDGAGVRRASRHGGHVRQLDRQGAKRVPAPRAARLAEKPPEISRLRDQRPGRQYNRNVIR